MKFSRLLLLTVLYSFTCAGADNKIWSHWVQNLNRLIQLKARQSLGIFNKLRSTISRRVQQNLASLNPYLSNSANTPKVNVQSSSTSGGCGNLGSTISQQVHDDLRPVREMRATFRIKFGEEGTTVATFKDKQLIVRDGAFYKCKGTISQVDGSCSGTLRKSSFKRKRDFCYANRMSIIQNWYCISTGSGSSSQFVNGKVYSEIS